MEEYLALCAQFKRRDILNPRVDTLGNVEGWVKFKDVWICASYMPDSDLIGTVMPAPPGNIAELVSKQELQRLIKEEAQKEATELVKKTAASGDKPKWFKETSSENPTTKHSAEHLRGAFTTADVIWIKERIREALLNLERDERWEGMTLLKALVGMPRQLKPAAEEQAAENFIKKYRAEELERYEKWEIEADIKEKLGA